MASMIKKQPSGGSAAHNVVRDALQEMVINDAVADAHRAGRRHGAAAVAVRA